jgi:hypothetical protein
MAYRSSIGVTKHREMTDSPEPFFFRLNLGVLLSLAAATMVPVDMAFDEEAAAVHDDGGAPTTPALARR